LTQEELFEDDDDLNPQTHMHTLPVPTSESMQVHQ